MKHKINWLFPFQNNRGDLTHFGNGVSVTSNTANITAAAGAGDLDAQNVFTAGTMSVAIVSATSVNADAMTANQGSLYGARVPVSFDGSASVHQGNTMALTSELFVTGVGLRAPFDCVAEIVLVTSGTGTVDRAIRVTATSISTGATVAAVSRLAAAVEANTVYTVIGGTTIGQGSYFTITSAITATVNTASLMVNLIEVSA